MPRHIVRLLVLMIAVGALAYGAKRFFTVNSFYEYGHYRGSSVADIASDKPKYKGSAYCQSCHAERFAEWSKGIHNSVAVGKAVQCEVCHGPAGERDSRGMFVNVATGADHPNNLKLIVPTDTRQLCTLCHEKMPGRPEQQRQIVVADHAGTQQCVTCHNPHSPKIEPASAAPIVTGDPAAGKIKAEPCAACHGAEGVSQDLPGATLAGQKPAYLVDALKAYRTRGRDNPMMSAALEATEETDIPDLVAYFSGLKCESSLDASQKVPPAAARCTACHGAAGVSANPAWPNLVGLSHDYLVAALKGYKEGERKNVLMSPVAKDLSDADAEAAASYYAGASCK